MTTAAVPTPNDILAITGSLGVRGDPFLPMTVCEK